VYRVWFKRILIVLSALVYMVLCVASLMHTIRTAAAGKGTAADAQHLNALLFAARMYQREHRGGCPELSDLRPVAIDLTGHNWATSDTAGRPFLVRCRGNRIEIRGVGVDGVIDTRDDFVGSVEWTSGDQFLAPNAAELRRRTNP
jgi:hypothetical protein